MKLVPFNNKDQQPAEEFIRVIYQEMGWVNAPKNSNLVQYFHLPHDGFFFLAKENDQIIGMAGCLRLNRTEGLIKRFYIQKDYRGKGIAQELLDLIINSAREMKLIKLVLDVSIDNKRAISFYERNGFLRFIPENNWVEGADVMNRYNFFLDI